MKAPDNILNVWHRLRYGASGNCFDLAIWLMDEFRKSAIPAYYIGESLGTTDAHVGVVAISPGGERFLCDLGDLWIQPVNLEAKVLNQPYFFTGAHISLEVKNEIARVEYLRLNGKKSEQEYNLKAVSEKDFLEAANFSQRNLSRPLIEMRIFNPKEVIHWEFENGKSFFSTLGGLVWLFPVSIIRFLRTIKGSTISFLFIHLRRYFLVAFSVTC